MHLENLALRHFKNFGKLDLALSPKLNGFIGRNGSGKTNLLDSIHYLGLTKSAFNYHEAQNIQHGQEEFQVKGQFIKNGKKTLVQCRFRRGEKKSLSLGRKRIDRLREYIGQYPVIIVAPNDTDLVREGAEVRRRFIDSFLSQLHSHYLANLVNYNRALKHRNRLLEDFARRSYFDSDLISSYDQTIVNLGHDIFVLRKAIIQDLVPRCQSNYDRLSDTGEAISVDYESDVDQPDFEGYFKSRLESDRASQRTTAGIHRDDLVFNLDGHRIKKFGSQGQQKSFVLALKLAQYQLTREEKKYPPLLLLDDIFDKLDDSRIAKLFAYVTSNEFGQLFVTDAGNERLPDMIKQMGVEAKIFRIENQIPLLLS